MIVDILFIDLVTNPLVCVGHHVTRKITPMKLTIDEKDALIAPMKKMVDEKNLLFAANT